MFQMIEFALTQIVVIAVAIVALLMLLTLAYLALPGNTGFRNQPTSKQQAAFRRRQVRAMGYRVSNRYEWDAD